MAAVTWYEFDRLRLVSEYLQVRARYPEFRLKRDGSVLSWHGSVHAVPRGLEAPRLKIRIDYPEAYPAFSPRVALLESTIRPDEIGHAWHRYPGTGSICYVNPRNWLISTTCADVIAKVEDWYFNYLAKKGGLVVEMPEVGRITLADAEEP